METDNKCQHSNLTLVKSPIFGFYLWCPSCHACWPPDGMKKEIPYIMTEKQARKYAKNNRMEIGNFLDQTRIDKRKSTGGDATGSVSGS
jgi:hypothetical protein